MNDNDDNDDDLYGDLMEQKLPASSTSMASSAKRQKLSSASLSSSNFQKDEGNSVSDPNAVWKQRVEELTNENNILKRNIGTLYRTAKKEMERKDKEIQRLTEELEKTRA